MQSGKSFALLLVGSVRVFIVTALFANAIVGHSSPDKLPQPEKADSILILKKEHTLELLSAGKVIRTHKVALGRGGLAPKQREGDDRTPEGRYVIDSKNAKSSFYRALHVSYPDAEDRKRAATRGVSPGGAIMIHGLPNGMSWVGASHHLYDWTKGCIAVTDQEIDEIWNLVPVGTPVEIRA
jgi:murein L,D-transpeptidase YafK